MSDTLQLVVLPSSQQTEDLLDILTIIKLSNYLFIVSLSNSINFDKQTGLLHKTESIIFSTQEKMPVIVFYEYYQEFDGIKYLLIWQRRIHGVESESLQKCNLDLRKKIIASVTHSKQMCNCCFWQKIAL